MSNVGSNRPLSEDELRLARHMLESGEADAQQFIEQLEAAEVTPWRCPCGCASINFQLKGHPQAPPGVHVLGDFVFGDQESLSGAFIFESDGLLSGIEVYGLAGDAPKSLPRPSELRPFASAASPVGPSCVEVNRKHDA